MQTNFRKRWNKYDNGLLIASVIQRLSSCARRSIGKDETIVARIRRKEEGDDDGNDEDDDDDEEISRLVDEGKPIGSPRSNNEEESKRAFSKVYVCAQNPMHTCSHALVCSAGDFFLAYWRTANERPRIFEVLGVNSFIPRELRGDRDLGAHTGCTSSSRPIRVQPSFLARWSIWEILTRAISYPDVRYWNLYTTVLCIAWKFVEQVWSAVSSAFKGNAWFSIEVTVTCPFAGCTRVSVCAYIHACA